MNIRSTTRFCSLVHTERVTESEKDTCVWDADVKRIIEYFYVCSIGSTGLLPFLCLFLASGDL